MSRRSRMGLVVPGDLKLVTEHPMLVERKRACILESLVRGVSLAKGVPKSCESPSDVSRPLTLHALLR